MSVMVQYIIIYIYEYNNLIFLQSSGLRFFICGDNCKLFDIYW